METLPFIPGCRRPWSPSTLRPYSWSPPSSGAAYGSRGAVRRACRGGGPPRRPRDTGRPLSPGPADLALRHPVPAALHCGRARRRRPPAVAWLPRGGLGGHLSLGAGPEPLGLRAFGHQPQPAVRRGASVRLLQARRARGEPIYIGAGAIPAWCYYSTDWSRPDTARIQFFDRMAAPGGPAFENAPKRGGPVGPAEGPDLAYRAPPGRRSSGCRAGSNPRRSRGRSDRPCRTAAGPRTRPPGSGHGRIRRSGSSWPITAPWR